MRKQLFVAMRCEKHFRGERDTDITVLRGMITPSLTVLSDNLLGVQSLSALVVQSLSIGRAINGGNRT